MMTQFDAEMLAVKYHDGQTYNGSPYWRHLNDVHNMLKRMGKNDDEVLQVGWLHDIIEDTDMTIDDLFTMGFSERVVAAVKCLTHDSENESYESYLEIVNSNPIARVVKRADMLCNLTQSVIDGREGLVHKYRNQIHKVI